MEMSILTNHLLISVVAWIGALIIGGGVGNFVARVLKPLMTAKPATSRSMSLFPWRSIIFMLLLLVWSPILGIWLGLGNLTGIAIVGLSLSLLALPMMMKARLIYLLPTSFLERIVSLARTLLMIALFATLGVGYVGAGGFGFYLMQQMNLLEYGKLYQGFFVLGVTALILDLVLVSFNTGHIVIIINLPQWNR